MIVSPSTCQCIQHCSGNSLSAIKHIYNIDNIFDILESHAFQKYCICLVFKALFELLIENGPRSEKE